VAQASGAAAKVLGLFSSETLEREPIIARVDENTCVACWYCYNVCPYGAIEKKEIKDKQGRTVRWVAHVNESVCAGCGLCNAICPSKSVELDGFDDEQTYAEIGALSEDNKKDHNKGV